MTIVCAIALMITLVLYPLLGAVIDDPSAVLCLATVAAVVALFAGMWFSILKFVTGYAPIAVAAVPPRVWHVTGAESLATPGRTITLEPRWCSWAARLQRADQPFGRRARAVFVFDRPPQGADLVDNVGISRRGDQGKYLLELQPLLEEVEDRDVYRRDHALGFRCRLSAVVVHATRYGSER